MTAMRILLASSRLLTLASCCSEEPARATVTVDGTGRVVAVDASSSLDDCLEHQLRRATPTAPANRMA